MVLALFAVGTHPIEFLVARGVRVTERVTDRGDN